MALGESLGALGESLGASLRALGGSLGALGGSLGFSWKRLKRHKMPIFKRNFLNPY